MDCIAAALRSSKPSRWRVDDEANADAAVAVERAALRHVVPKVRAILVVAVLLLLLALAFGRGQLRRLQHGPHIDEQRPVVLPKVAMRISVGVHRNVGARGEAAV
eukprot:3602955-Prymnesium_polylepis.1